MELLTPELRQMLPPLDSLQDGTDPLCQCHFFLPDTNWDWYPIEFDGIEIFYGWSSFIAQEMGMFYLSELRVIRGLLGMCVERDVNFTPMPLSEVKKLHPPMNGYAEQINML
jgi:Protein of unknown function (DUF2958)